MSVSILEQETHISFMRNDESAVIYTSDTTMITKFDKLVEKNPDEWTVLEETENGKTYKAPVGLVSYRSKSKKMTAEQKKELSERAKKNFHA